MSPTNRARFLLFILLFQLPDAVLTTLPLLASHSHQVIVCVNRSFQTFSNTSMRRNFPRPYTTTYLRVVVVGQLVALADSEITAFLPVVLTGFVTVSFHSIRVAVSFDAVSAHAQPVLSLQSASPSCHAPSILAYLPGLPLRVPRRWWKVADSNRWLIVAGLPHRYRLFPSLYRGNYLLG